LQQNITRTWLNPTKRSGETRNQLKNKFVAQNFFWSYSDVASVHKVLSRCQTVFQKSRKMGIAFVIKMTVDNNTRDSRKGIYTAVLSCNIVVSCADPLGNVSWMLFQEGWSSNLRLRWGVRQAAHTRNNPHIKCTGVYCA